MSEPLTKEEIDTLIHDFKYALGGIGGPSIDDVWAEIRKAVEARDGEIAELGKALTHSNGELAGYKEAVSWEVKLHKESIKQIADLQARLAKIANALREYCEHGNVDSLYDAYGLAHSEEVLSRGESEGVFLMRRALEEIVKLYTWFEEWMEVTDTCQAEGFVLDPELHLPGLRDYFGVLARLALDGGEVTMFIAKNRNCKRRKGAGHGG